MAQTLPNGTQIPNGVSVSAWNNGQIAFLSGRTQIPGFMDLSPSELSIFHADIQKLAYMTALERDLSQFFLSMSDTFLFAASIAKSGFRGLTVAGLLGGGGYNFSMIRPQPILSSLTVADGGGAGALITTWKRTFTGTGWQSLFGTDTDQVSLGVTGSSTTAVTTYGRVMICAPYLLSTGSSPKFVEIRPRVLQTTYPVYPLHWIPLSDIYIAKFPASLLALPNDAFDVEANIGTTGDDVPQLFGLQFNTFDYAALIA